MKYLRLHALTIVYLHAHFFNMQQSARLCAHLFLSHAWAKFLLYTPFCQRIWIIWIIIKYIHMRIKKYVCFFTFFFLLSWIVLHSSKFGCGLRSHIRWKDRVSTFLFSCKMLRSLVFWYCSSLFCPLDLCGPWCHRRSRKFIFLHYTPSKI